MGLLSSKTAVGLEIDRGMLRAVQLRGSARRPILVSYGQVEIPEEAVDGGVIVEVEEVANGLRALWSSARIRKKDVILGMATSGLLLRPISFPKVPIERLPQAIQMQANDYFPIAVSQLVVDFALLGEHESENGTVLDVFLVAARKEELARSMEALDGGGLRTQVVDVEPFALIRHLPVNGSTVVMVDIANGVTSLVVVRDGLPRFSRILSVGLGDLADAGGTPVWEVFETPLSSNVADDEATVADRALNPWKSGLAAEVNTSINYYLAMNHAEAVDSVVLSGRGSRVPELDLHLEEALGLPVELLDPWKSVATSRKLGTDAQDYAVSIGLALRGLEEV